MPVLVAKVAVVRPVLPSTVPMLPAVMGTPVVDIDPLLMVPLSFTSSLPLLMINPVASVVNAPTVEIGFWLESVPPTRKIYVLLASDAFWRAASSYFSNVPIAVSLVSNSISFPLLSFGELELDDSTKWKVREDLPLVRVSVPRPSGVIE